MRVVLITNNNACIACGRTYHTYEIKTTGGDPPVAGFYLLAVFRIADRNADRNTVRHLNCNAARDAVRFAASEADTGSI